MKKKPIKPKFIKMFTILILIAIGYTSMPLLRAAGHHISIISPTPSSLLSNVVGKTIDNTETTFVRFCYVITNDDGYYEFYEAYLDDIFDPYLMGDPLSSSSVSFITYYPAQTFLDRYGQGTHTITIKAYHRYVILRGLAEGYSDDADIVWIGSYSYKVDYVSVTFTFDPPVVHYLGFWFDGKWKYDDGTEEQQNFSNSILGFSSLLWSNNSHYLHGSYLVSGEWDRSQVQSFLQSVSIADNPNDIVIIHFVTHGAGVHLGDLGIALGALRKCTGGQYSLNGWYSKTNLQLDLANAQSDTDGDGYKLDSQLLLLIVDSCYSGGFTSIAEHIDYCTVFTGAKKSEYAYFLDNFKYDPSWHLSTKVEMIAYFFTHAIAKALYNGGYDLINLWDQFPNYTRGYNDPITKGEQHPQRSDFSFDESIYLYIP